MQQLQNEHQHYFCYMYTEIAYKQCPRTSLTKGEKGDEYELFLKRVIKHNNHKLTYISHTFSNICPSENILLRWDCHLHDHLSHIEGLTIADVIEKAAPSLQSYFKILRVCLFVGLLVSLSVCLLVCRPPFQMTWPFGSTSQNLKSMTSL
jgi:hypothetical protein